MDPESTNDSDCVYVLCWEYSDNSGAGVLRAYSDHSRATEDLELIANCGATDFKEYRLERIPLLG